MKRAFALAGLVLVAAAAVAVVERLTEDRRYRALLSQGEQAMDEGRSYAAIESFSGALALRPQSMVAYYRRGEAYGEQGQLETAIRDLRSARSLAPNAREPLEALGRLYERRGDYAEAARWFTRATGTLQDADPSLLYRLALARYRAGDPAGARDPLRRAVASDDAMVRAHVLLGLVYRDSQQPNEAIAALQHAIRLSPSLVTAHEELADLYRSLGRLDDERKELVALVAADPQTRRTLALALADIRAGRFDSAHDALVGLASSAPGDSRVAVALGRLYLARAEQTPEPDQSLVALARSALETALAGTARRSEGLALYGRAVYLSGDDREAEQLLQEATATAPVAPEAFGYLADCAERLRHPGVARDALLTLDALQGDTVTRETRLARSRRIGALALESDAPDTALRLLTTVVKSGVSDAGTLALLAQAEWATGDPAGARATLTLARAKAPNDAALTALARRFR